MRDVPVESVTSSSSSERRRMCAWCFRLAHWGCCSPTRSRTWILKGAGQPFGFFPGRFKQEGRGLSWHYSEGRKWGLLFCFWSSGLLCNKTNVSCSYQGREKKKLRASKDFFLLALKCVGKPWDKHSLMSVKAPTSNFGELLWNKSAYVRFDRRYIFNCK